MVKPLITILTITPKNLLLKFKLIILMKILKLYEFFVDFFLWFGFITDVKYVIYGENVGFISLVNKKRC